MRDWPANLLGRKNNSKRQDRKITKEYMQLNYCAIRRRIIFNLEEEENLYEV